MNKFTRNFNKINVENNSSSYIYSPNLKYNGNIVNINNSEEIQYKNNIHKPNLKHQYLNINYENYKPNLKHQYLNINYENYKPNLKHQYLNINYENYNNVNSNKKKTPKEIANNLNTNLVKYDKQNQCELMPNNSNLINLSYLQQYVTDLKGDKGQKGNNLNKNILKGDKGSIGHSIEDVILKDNYLVFSFNKFKKSILVKNIKGTKGNPALKGIKGEQGSRGNNGDKGDKGIQGKE